VARPRRHLRHPADLILGAALLVCIALASGCSTQADEPLRDSREALGTIVTVTLYGGESGVAQRLADEAFEAIAKTEADLSAYPDVAADPSAANNPAPAYEVTSVAQFNRDPFRWHVLPPEATRVLGRVEGLSVGEFFSPGMLRVIGLYDFEGKGTVPDSADLSRLVRAAQAFETSSGATVARFKPGDVLLAPPSPPTSSFAPPAVGLDLSGAVKGLALDEALSVLEKGIVSGKIGGAILSAGSTTLVTGDKSRGKESEPWQIGIEDPRDPERVTGIVQYSLSGRRVPEGRGAFGAVSTSGDYQQSFTRDGVRYHHILDPVTGMPARGMRSLTVVGGGSGLDSDILSTALFVMGIERAETYARDHGLGLFIVDDEGRTRIVPGPTGAPFSITRSN
jgi:thiamine biosynthesis lipoprotein